MVAAVSPEQRHKRNSRCPICDGAEQDTRGRSVRCTGFTSEDGKWAHCTREEFASGLEQNGAGAFAHKLHGDCRCGVSHGPAVASFSDVVAKYDYVDERGDLLFQVVRKTPKGFLQRKPDGAGGWIWKMEGVRRVPYRLPELIAADPAAVVFVCEGEKDCDTAHGLGMVATCNPGGASKWTAVADVAGEVLRGREVVIIADADASGRAHAHQVATSLANVATVRIIECPDGHKDLTDWVKAGGTVRDVLELAGRAPPDPAVAPPSGAWAIPEVEVVPKGLPFPSDALPASVRQWVLEEAEFTQTPVDLAGVLAIAVLAAASARRASIMLKPRYFEPLNLYVAVALLSAERKSAVFKDAAKPLADFEEELIMRVGPEARTKGLEKSLLEKELKTALTRAAKSGDPADKEAVESISAAHADLEVPELPRIVVDDVTPERLTSLLAVHGALALMSPEGGMFATFAGRYSSNIPNFDVLLKAHAAESMTVDRVGRPPERLRHPHLTLGLAVQPMIIDELVRNDAFRRRGLVARVLFSAPASFVGRRSIDSAHVSDHAAKAYAATVHAILQLEKVVDGADGEGAHLLRLDSEAFEEWRKFFNAIEPRLASDLKHMADWAGKLCGAVGRIAGILHMAHHAAEGSPWRVRVSAATMRNAISLGEYFLSQSIVVLSSCQQGKRESLLDYVRENVLKLGKSPVTQREISRKTGGKIENVKDLEALIGELIEEDFLRPLAPVEGSKAGSRKKSFDVNPHAQKRAQ